MHAKQNHYTIYMNDKNNECNKKYIFRGKEFSQKDIEIIKNVLKDYGDSSRTFQSKLICKLLNWRQANGVLKDRACRDVLLRMHKAGLIYCPPIRLKRRQKNKGGALRDQIKFDIVKEEITGKAGQFKEIRFEIARGKDKEGLWDYLIYNYHYKGYKVLVGHYIKYLIYLDDKLVACIGFSDAVLHLNIRDKWIGWDAERRKKNLHLIINNSRYLILPWVKVKYLSSKILASISRRIRQDWGAYYGYEPMLIETFVEVDRFSGTSYKAANWIYLGRTKGKGRSGMNYFYHGIQKDVYVYPLIKKARERLLND